MTPAERPYGAVAVEAHDPIERRAERIVEARRHVHRGADRSCVEDHRPEPARRAAALDALATVWAYAGRDEWIEALYNEIEAEGVEDARRRVEAEAGQD